MGLRTNALFLAVLATVLAIAGAWSGTATLEKAWLLPVALLLLGLAYEAWMVQRAATSLEVSSEPRSVLGRPFTLSLTLRQRLHRDTFAELAPEGPEAIEVDTTVRTVSLPKGEPARLEIRATARRLGKHAWPVWRSRIAGPLGLAWWSRKLATNLSTQVIPDLLSGAAARSGGRSGGRHARALLGSGAEILQLRDYRPGDPQNVIDWKASARSGRLVSRDVSEDQHLEIVLASMPVVRARCAPESSIDSVTT
jgi:uncharacterized protein (DUF58 family)